MAQGNPSEIEVWDPFVRVAHWAIAIGFFVAYFAGDEILGVHVWAGYVVGALVLLRIIWGFVGPHYARFTDFACRPRTAIGYFWDLLLARARRYVGHSPAGGAMVLALLFFLAATVATGLVVYAQEEGAGPLAPLYSTPVPSAAGSGGAASHRAEDGEHKGGRRRSALKEIHEVIANVTLALVGLHILGVILASFVHHENLVRAMITGRKRAEASPVSTTGAP